MDQKTRKLISHPSLLGLPINDKFFEKFAQLVAEDCAGICEEMGTTVAGCNNGVPTNIADDCADWIRKDFGIK